MKENYRIVTEDGKEILRTETYAGCESYWNACNGIYEDESGEHYLSIEEIKEGWRKATPRRTKQWKRM